MGGIIVLILCLIVLVTAASCIRIVPQANAYVVERLGAYQGTWAVGIHFKVPFIDKVAKKSHFKGTGSGFCAAAGDYKR